MQIRSSGAADWRRWFQASAGVGENRIMAAGKFIGSGFQFGGRQGAGIGGVLGEDDLVERGQAPLC